MSANKILVIYSTFPSEKEAKEVAKKLLEKQLVACANVIDGATSLFRWEGKLCEEKEAIMILKTSADNLQATIDFIKNIHSYDCPAIVSWPVELGNQDYIKWVNDETKTSRSPDSAD